MEAGKERLARDTLGDATQQEVLQLRRENGELKQLVAELSLQAHRLKKTAIPTLHDAAGTNGCALWIRRRYWPRWLPPVSPNAGSSGSSESPGAPATGG